MSYLHSLAKAGLIGSLIFSSCATVASQDPNPSKKVIINFEVDDGAIRVVINGDDVSVELNGKQIDHDRLELEGNWLQIKNKSGWPVAFGNFDEDSFGFNFVDAPKMHAWLGVDLRPVSAALAAHLELDSDEVSQIVSVTPDSPAAKGGLLEHDIVLSFDGQSPATGEGLREILADKEPGDMLAIGMLRKGKELELEIELGESAGSYQGWPGFTNLLFGSGGEAGHYTRPDLKKYWGAENLLNYGKLYGAYKFYTKDGGKLNQLLYWGKSKGGKTGGVGLGQVFTSGANKTFFLPEVHGLLGAFGEGLTMASQAKDTDSTKTLAKQLSDMAKQLEALQALLEKQQEQAKRRDN